MVIGVIPASLAAALLTFPVETSGSKFGGIPHSLPAPHLLTLSLSLIMHGLAGDFESLLSA